MRERQAPAGRMARVATLALATLALGALLAACGGAGAGGTSGEGTARATKTTLTPSATATKPTPTNTPGTTGTANASCPAGALAAAAPNPTLIVTSVDRSRTFTAQAGAVIEIRLAAGPQRWQLGSKGAPTLTPLQAQGNYVAGLHACVWDFTAAQTGRVTLGFVGEPNCQSRKPCAQYAILLPFTFSVG